MVSGNYRMFGFHDPTCEEIDNFSTAQSGASARDVGWAPNALMVQLIYDLVNISVQVEVYEGDPSNDGSADLLHQGRLALPGGTVSIPQSLDEEWQRGVALPAGAGTYDVHIFGYGRERAKALREQQMTAPADQPVAGEAFDGVESYRIRLRQISPEPGWPDDEDDD